MTWYVLFAAATIALTLAVYAFLVKHDRSDRFSCRQRQKIKIVPRCEWLIDSYISGASQKDIENHRWNIDKLYRVDKLYENGMEVSAMCFGNIDKDKYLDIWLQNEEVGMLHISDDCSDGELIVEEAGWKSAVISALSAYQRKQAGERRQLSEDLRRSLLNIKKADLTIEELYRLQQSYKGQEIFIRGRVIKYNANVMGKNWIHLQDGSGKPGSNNVVVTTAKESRVGDVALARGVVTFNKDFGMGYIYPIFIDNASVTIEESLR